MMAVEFPDWLPLLVREEAEKALAQAARSSDDDELAMVRRITRDPRMRAVWKYLQGREGLTHREYKNPVRDPMPGADYHPKEFSTRAEWLQQVGLAEIYKLAHYWGCLCLPSRQIESDADRYFPSKFSGLPNQFQDQAAALRATADAWSHQCQQAKEQGLKRYYRALEKSISRINDLAEDFEELEKIWDEHWKPTKLKQKDQVALVTARIAGRMNSIFRQPMYGQTATIASLVLNVTVTRQKAREHCRGLWGPRRRKKI